MNFMKFKWLYFLLSALVLIPGIICLIIYGLRPAIDFTGGTLLELKFEKKIDMSEYSEIKKMIEEKDFEISSIQSSGEKAGQSGGQAILLRLKPITKNEVATIKTLLASKFEEIPEEVRFETVGPTLGKELLNKTLIAIVLAAGFILAYVALQFKNAKFGVCAILAMLHDSFILLGSFSLMGHFFGVEVDTLFVTAILTTLSLSVHDTVFVYGRIRELQNNFPDMPFEQIINKAITETIVRSLNDSLVIIFMLAALLLLGGETIRWFVAALLIGTIAGTYSSNFTATPLLIVWDKIFRRNTI